VRAQRPTDTTTVGRLARAFFSAVTQQSASALKWHAGARTRTNVHAQERALDRGHDGSSTVSNGLAMVQGNLGGGATELPELELSKRESNIVEVMRALLFSRASSRFYTATTELSRGGLSLIFFTSQLLQNRLAPYF
jgi:hypothetical protein